MLNDLLQKADRETAGTEAKLSAVEEAMVAAAACSRLVAESESCKSTVEREKLRHLIHARRMLKENPCLTEPARMQKQRALCKDIQKLMRKHLRAKKVEKIRSILSNFRGLKEIAWIKGTSSRKSIEAMKDRDGKTVTDKEGISNVFANFYEELYCRQSHGRGEEPNGAHPLDLGQPAAEFSMTEIEAALNTMRRGKAGDDAGIVAEMIKDGSQLLLQTILDLFNEVLALREGTAPSSWKCSRLSVIFKKGDRDLPKNYRPIALLSILYKLFSRMLCNRLADLILPQQGPEQAAYRPSFSTGDHLLTTALLIERSQEYNVPVWTALVDFEKAFDMVDQGELWNVLQRQGVPEQYLALLKQIYRDQVAYVHAGARSRNISIERGVRQGDPLSALLFIAIMQDLCGTLQVKWAKASARRKGHPFGIEIAKDGRFLTNLRFADDVLLVAQSKSDLVKMLTHFSDRSSVYGLKLNYDKTKILTWDRLRRGCSAVTIHGRQVEVLAENQAEKYLGRKLCFQNSQATELNHRLACAWASFHKHKSELCGKNYNVNDRVKLFEAVVSTTLLYGCCSWALTMKMEKILVVQRRRMLRYVFRVHRQPSETWVEYMKRSAAHIDELSERQGLQTWAHTYRQTKWRFAGATARQTDNRWSKVILGWKPDSELGRDRGRPVTRWSDDIEALAGGSWQTAAEDTNLWSSLERGFVERIL